MSGHRSWRELRAEHVRRQLDVLTRWFGADVVYADVKTSDPGAPLGYVILELRPNGGDPCVLPSTIHRSVVAAEAYRAYVARRFPRLRLAVAEVRAPRPGLAHGDFFEEDEPVEDVVRAFEVGRPTTATPEHGEDVTYE